MGMSDDIKDLESEQRKLRAEIIQLKEQLQKQTPEAIQSILNKSIEINDLSSKITSIYTSILSTNDKISAAAEAINNNLPLSNNVVNNLEQLEEEAKKLFHTIETSSDEINNLLKNAQNISSDLGNIDTDIKIKSQRLEEIDSINNTSIELKEKIDLLHTNINKNYDEIYSLHIKIFGFMKKDDKGEEFKVTGFKDDLDKSYSQLTTDLTQLRKEIETSILESQNTCSNIKVHWEQEHTSLKNEIIALLPSALTTGLSYAYKEKKDSEIQSMENLNQSFQRAIIGLIIISMIPFTVSIYSLLFQGNTLEDVIFKLPRLVMAILPLYIPVLWIAYSSSKKINLSKRLVEEYSHKEALSKTFEGLSGQINNIQDSPEKDELKARLLYNLLEVSAENPGKLIYDYNNADHPLMDALDKSVKLSGAITKLANIPGITKISEILIEKNKKVQTELDNKATEGLETSEEVKG